MSQYFNPFFPVDAHMRMLSFFLHHKEFGQEWEEVGGVDTWATVAAVPTSSSFGNISALYLSVNND